MEEAETLTAGQRQRAPTKLGVFEQAGRSGMKLPQAIEGEWRMRTLAQIALKNGEPGVARCLPSPCLMRNVLSFKSRLRSFTHSSLRPCKTMHGLVKRSPKMVAKAWNLCCFRCSAFNLRHWVNRTPKHCAQRKALQRCIWGKVVFRSQRRCMMRYWRRTGAFWGRNTAGRCP